MVPGVARFIVMLSAHAGVFGVGITPVAGSVLVLARSVTAGWIVPGGGPLGISGAETGKAAPLVGGPPGVELHTVVDGLPSGDTGDMVPVALPRMSKGMLPGNVAGVIASDGIVVVDDIVVAAVPCTEVEIVPIAVDGTTIGAVVADGRADAAGGNVAGKVKFDTDRNVVAGCAENVRYRNGEQVTTVPGVAGYEAIGTGASVVSGVPARVVAENGLGPFNGEITIAPGVVARPMDVVPRVETCARQAVQHASRVTIVSSKRRIGITPSARVSSSDFCARHAPRPCCHLPGPPSD
jgi:hypothetical protein